MLYHDGLPIITAEKARHSSKIGQPVLNSFSYSLDTHRIMLTLTLLITGSLLGLYPRSRSHFAEYSLIGGEWYDTSCLSSLREP
jgi:hypothetical protein